MNLLPLGIRCEFLTDQRPEAFFMADRIFQINHRTFKGIEWLEKQEEALLVRLRKLLLTGEKGCVVVRGREPMNVRWDNLRGRFGLAKKDRAGG